MTIKLIQLVSFDLSNNKCFMPRFKFQVIGQLRIGLGHTITKATKTNYYKTRQTRSSKTGLVWQDLQCMGCSKLLAEGGYDRGYDYM